jgi:hypothetical protein
VAYSIEDSRFVRCSPDALFKRVLDPGTWPRWQPEILATDESGLLAEGDVVHGRARMLGFQVQGRSTALQVGPTTFEEDVVVGVRMRVRYEVRARDDGCVVTQRMVVDMPRGFSGKVLSALLRWRLKKMQRATLANLAAQAEADASV